MGAYLWTLAYVVGAFLTLAIGRALAWWPFWIGEMVSHFDPRHPAHHWDGRGTRPEAAEVEYYRQYDLFEGRLAGPMAVIWPIALILMAGHRTMVVADRSRAKKVKLRAELERELAEARKQVEDLLK